MADSRGLASARLQRAPIALAVLALCALAPVARAEVKVLPSVEVRETWTDNVSLQNDDARRSAWVTEIAPSIGMYSNSRRLKLRAEYAYRYFKSTEEHDGVQNHSNQLNADLHSILVDDLLFFDAGGTIGQQAVSPFGQQINDNPYASANRTEIRTWRLSPYLVHRFGAFATGQLRYVHDHVGGGRQVGFGQSGGDTASFSLASGPSFTRFGWSAQGSRQVIDDDKAGKSSSTTESVNVSWSASRTFSLTGSGGYDKYSFAGPGGDTTGAFWSTGFSWVPSTRTAVKASFGHRFFGKTYELSALHRSRQTSWNIGYSEEVTTMRSQMTLPAAFDTAALLDNLFRSQIPDAAQRAAAVQAYIKATGLPPSLTDSISYLSNRYILQKEFQASAAWRMARSSMVVTLVDTRRHALSAIESDSALLGSVRDNTNDDTRMQGLTGMWNWQLNARSAVNLGLTASRTKSLTVERDDKNRAVRLGMSSQFKPKLRGSVEVRHVIGTLGGGARDYTENAVAAALTLQL